MQLPQWLARLNRYVTNPIQRRWAGRAPSFGILEHVGRKSGKPYRIGNTRYQNYPNSVRWVRSDTPWKGWRPCNFRNG